VADTDSPPSGAVNCSFWVDLLVFDASAAGSGFSDLDADDSLAEDAPSMSCPVASSSVVEEAPVADADAPVADADDES